MIYFKSWQAALAYFLELYGHNYEDPYNLVVEFELNLKQNKRGAYYVDR